MLAHFDPAEPENSLGPFGRRLTANLVGRVLPALGALDGIPLGLIPAGGIADADIEPIEPGQFPLPPHAGPPNAI